jgi:hypothetical protein
LNYDLAANDVVMRRWNPYLCNDLKIHGVESLCLATTIFNDMLASPNLHEFAATEADEKISFSDRFNELACYINFQTQRSAEGELNPLEDRARLVLSNYVCFVYLNESCFLKLCKFTTAGSAARKCFKYLTSNRVRWFRNAVAHANWSVSDGTITYWSKKGSGDGEPLDRFTVEDEERSFWLFLSLCVATSAFAALTSLSKRQ